MPTIGKYEVQSELGRGGFGRVYKAFDPIVGRSVAIKILTHLDDPGVVERFKAEAVATGKLHHPNIVTIYDFGEHEGSPYIVMEHLEGKNLRQLIDAGQPLSLLDKVGIMAQVGKGLQYAHENGIVHRDVKPANIQVLPGGDVKVMDFGIALLVGDNIGRRTQSGFLVGTILYMSPEQLRGQDADALSDIFAYGSVFYELLSGKHPFQAPDSAGIMFKLVSEEPAPLSEVAPGCPVALDQIVMRALRKDRDHRYQSFADLLLDLQTVLLDLEKQRAKELVGKARGLVTSGDIIAAETMIRDALHLDPADPEARELRAQVRDSLRQMSVQSRIEAGLKAVDEQIAAGLFSEAIASLESARNLSPESPEIAQRLEEARVLQEQQSRVPPPGPEKPPAPVDEAGREDRTVLVSRIATDLPPPAPRKVAPAPGDFTAYFGKPAPGKASLNAYLTVVSCPDSFREGQTVPIVSSCFRIGRSRECELSISEDRTLSRQHASISWNGSGFSITDLGSPNGTYLNGRKLPSSQAELLPLNAEIRLSNDTRLRFRCDISELPDFSGQKLANRYTLEKCLRASRKSAFYEGADSRPVRKVAVKLLSPTLASYPGYLDQFEREAQTAAGLDHPNICKIYEHGCAPLEFTTGETKSVHYLCMQMLDGGSLASRLDAPEHTTAAAVSSWLDVVADALNTAHRNGVVHAGLKPTSVVFNALGTPYLTDFAIATRPQDAARSEPSLGAPEYLAPEQWDGLAAEPRTDQYSLACLCYRALAGVVPFENQLDPLTRRRNFEQGAVPVHVRGSRHGGPPIPPLTSTVLARALSVRPEDRFPATTDFALAFRQSLGEVPAPSRKPRVFVSYRREADAGWAALFADKLGTQHGLDVFVDRHRVDSARQVPEKIESAIRDCDFFVCLLARTTLQSAWVREEIRIADAANKPMIPVVQEGFRRQGKWPVPKWLEPFVPRAWLFPECAKRLMDAEEVRLFADYDEGAIEKLAKMILSVPEKT